MNKTKQLKPCPFCGSKAELSIYNTDFETWTVACTNENCDITMGKAFFTKQEAINHWNRRTSTCKELTPMRTIDIDDKIQNIKDILNQIEPNKITILTGSNGSGKSLIRQQLKFKLSKKLNIDAKHLTADVSMAKRTASNPCLGAMATFMNDDPTDPTSLSTYQHIKTLFHCFVYNVDTERKYLILDEPEIGMAKESQFALTNYIKENIPGILQNTYGMLIITHSEFIVNELKDQTIFLNMDGIKTADDWINRTIHPTDFKELADTSLELYRRLSKIN